MSDSARIVLVSPVADAGSDLGKALGSGFIVSVSTPSQAAMGLPACDAVLLDDRLGRTQLRSILLDVAHHASGASIVVLKSRDHDETASSFIRMGAQDVIDTRRLPEDALRERVSMSIERAHILGITQEAAIHIRSVVEHVSDAVLIVDDARDVVFANPACEDMLRMPIQSLYGAPCPFPFDPDMRTLDFDRPDGTVLRAGVFLHTVNWDGREASMLAMRDLTAEAEIRETLLRARSTAEKTQELKASFLANMSHELRMPLASIIGFAEIIEEGSTDDEMKEFASLIQESGSRLLHSINAVLDMTRLEAGRFEPDPEEVDAAGIIQRSVRLLRPLAAGKGLDLVCHGPESISMVTDALFVERIMNNLVGNAIKFTESGSISVSWSLDGDVLNVSVRDTGIGMAESFLPELFDEFTQESTGRSRSHDGTGLGLAITRKLVERLGGHIEVESQKGKGSTFTVIIPPSES